MDVGRTLSWLTHDRQPHWRAEIRKRSEDVDQAKAALSRRELTAATEGQSFIEYKKAIRKAEARLEEAKRKLASVRRWISEMERQMLLYQGQIQRVRTLVGSTLPRARGAIERSVGQLERYASVAPEREHGAPEASRPPAGPPAEGSDQAGEGDAS